MGLTWTGMLGEDHGVIRHCTGFDLDVDLRIERRRLLEDSEWDDAMLEKA
jgi:hypothetical protein